MAPGTILRGMKRGDGAGRAAIPPLPALLFVEGLWAFAFYSVQTTLTLYLSDHAATMDAVWGWRDYRRLVGEVTGASTPLAVASATYGLFSACSYTLPMATALMSRAAAVRRRVLPLALLVLAVGHLLLATGPGFLLGLGVVALGVGLLKTRLVSLIGVAAGGERGSRTRAFNGYVLAANVGALSAPLISGTLCEKVSWTLGYGVGAVAIAAAGLLYAVARLGALDAPQTSVSAALPGLREAGRRRGVGLTLLCEVLFFSAYNQAFNIFPVWAQRGVDRSIGGFELPVTWFNALDGALSIGAVLVASRLWRGCGRARSEGTALEASRLAVGGALGAAGFLTLASASLCARAPLAPVAGFFLLIDLAIPWIDAVVLARLARLSSPAGGGVVFGTYFLSVAAASLATGWIGRLYEAFGATGFWLLNAALAGSVVIVAVRLRRGGAHTA